MRPRLNGSTLWTFCLIIAAGALLVGQPANADIFRWLGSVDTDWQTSANWSGGAVPDFNGPPSGTTWGHRLQVDQGASRAELVYDGSLGTTVYASPGGSPNQGRGLIMGNGATGTMRITGGTFSTSGSASSDLVGHQSSGNGTLTIAGGSYISSTTGLYLGTGGGGTATLTVDSGSALITTLRMNATTATVNLNGGTLQANIIDVQGGTNTFNFNGGTLVAGTSSATFMQGLNTANVRDGGAIINTNGYAITIAQALLHSSISGDADTDGGLTKTGSNTLTLSGTNTYTGDTNITGGVLRINNASALGGTTAGTTVANGARIELAGGITVNGESLTISGSGGNHRGALQTQSGANTWAGNVTLGASDTRIGAVGAGNSLTISGAIGDGGTNRTLAIRNDGGTTILSGENTYGGNTDVVIGLLKIDGGDNRLPTGTVLRMGYTEGSDVSTFDLNGWNQQVAGLLSRTTTTTTVVTNSSATPSTLTVNNTSGYTYSGVLAGNLALTKTNAGTLTLSGANTYTGLTTVNAGTLLVSGSLANNGSSHVQIASAGTAFGSADPTVVRRIAAGGSFAGLGSRIAGSGTFGTQADLMAGSNGGGGALDVAMAWRTFDSAETAAFPALTNPLSDVVQLTGMGTGETDPFVLQMSYSSSLVQPYHDGMFLAWLSPADGWTNAVEGNIGSGASAVAGATGSWDSIIDAGELASYLGSWGIDSTSGTAWAVLNHNSQFAVLAVPEPSSLLLGGMGLMAMLLAVRRRRS